MPEYTLTRHRGKWSITFRDGGKVRRITTSTDDRGLAEARASRIWESLNAPRSDRIADIWPRYVQDRKQDGVQVERFPPIWKALEPYFGHLLAQSVTKQACRKYYQERKSQGMADSTARTELTLLRACLKYAGSNGAVWLPPASPPRQKFLTKEELTKILDATNTPHIQLFIILAVTTGARMSAILDLEWERVDFANGTVNYQPAGRIKTNKRRVEVPMNSRCRAALEEAYQARLTDHVIEFGGKPVKSVKKALQRLSARVGISFSAHVFRHTCAVWMAQADVPMSKIAQYLGHTKTAMTEEVYARYSPSYMKDASEAVNW